ncbi:MAG: HAD hydrolase family protein [Tidjanibacter sp.]|nr:HAD hydrolase family protein [Tidjanibacter sp.]
MANFKEDLAKVEAFIFDIDGVFTDGSITPIPTPDGSIDIVRTYYAQDGYAVNYAHRNGYKIFIISGGHGATLRRRFESLGATEVHLEVVNKIGCLRDVIARHGLNAENVVYMGDDIPDLECMREVGLPVAPANAAWECVDAARYVSEFCGGRGCVRDVIEQVLRAHGKWALNSEGVSFNHK